MQGAKFGQALDRILQTRPLFSLWNEPYFTCDGELGEVANAFKRDELSDQVCCFVILTSHALSKLPPPSPSRKKMLALRKWAAGHLDFWVNGLRRPVTLIHDRRDGYSPCHRFLRMLLTEIDPDSLPKLGTILRAQRAELREESAPD